MNPSVLPGHPAAHFGPGVAGRLAEVIGPRPARVLVVRGRASYHACGVAPIVAGLEARHQLRHVTEGGANPTVDQLEAALAVARSFAPHVVLGIGGGSRMDLAKAVAVLAEQPGKAVDHLRGRHRAGGRDSRLVLLPTTAGSGSELTRFATIYVGHEKHSLESPWARADTVLVDPDLVASTPVATAAAAGADALCQAVESYWAVSATTASRALARQAVTILVPATDALVRADGRLDDPPVRASLARGAALAGAAIDLTRTTGAHALSYALTARLGIPHGLAVALHLTWLLDHHAAVATVDCVHPGGPGVLRGLVDDVQGICRQATGAWLSELLARLLALGGCPPRLADLGLRAADWVPPWRAALASARAGNNPRLVTLTDVLAAVTGDGPPRTDRR